MAAAERAAAAVLPRTQLTREQALQQAQAEGLVLRRADNKSGYANVSMPLRALQPYQAPYSYTTAIQLYIAIHYSMVRGMVYSMYTV